MQKSMSKMLWLVGLFFIIVFGIYGVKQALFRYFMSHYQPPAVIVAVHKVQQKTWQPYLESIGTVQAIHGVDLSAQVSGIIKSIQFKAGDNVAAGQPLILLESQVQEADLKNAQAKLQLAQISYEREQTLFNRKASSKANLDARFAELSQAQAGVAAAQAQLNQRIIIAPFSGQIGIRLVDVGQYVSPGTPLVSLQSADPLYVNFTLPEQATAALSLGEKVAVNLENSKQAIIGAITAINNKVDPETRNILVQATIPNARGSIYPGQFANVKIFLPTTKKDIVIPQTAIAYSLSGDFVFVVEKDSQGKLIARRRYISIGERRGNEAVISKGLSGNEQIVTSGQLKLQPDAHIKIDNSQELHA